MKTYELKREQGIDVGFKLGDEVIPVACDLDRAARDYPRIGQELDVAYAQLREADSQNFDERYIRLGNVVRALLDLMFGPNAQKVIDFYESKWIEMLIQLLPCLQESVLPAITDYAKEQQAKILAMQSK